MSPFALAAPSSVAEAIALLEPTATLRELSGPSHVRPKNAASLIIIDRSGPQPKVLMGRRHPGHKYMPGVFVFPGGRPGKPLAVADESQATQH